MNPGDLVLYKHKFFARIHCIKNKDEVHLIMPDRSKGLLYKKSLEYLKIIVAPDSTIVRLVFNL